MKIKAEGTEARSNRGFVARCRSAGAMATLLGFAVMGCTTYGPADAASNVEADVVEPSQSALGNYLAGRHAKARADTASAAMFYNAALTEDPENQVLLQRTFLLRLAEGRMDEAAILAERRIQARVDAPMARLALAVFALRDGDFAVAREHVESMDRAGFASLMQPMILSWIEAGEQKFDAASGHLDALKSRQAFDAFRSYHSALIAELAQDADAAEAGYREALAGDGRNATRLILSYGALMAGADRLEETKALFTDYLKRVPGNPAVERALSDLAAGERPTPVVTTVQQGAAEAFLGAAGALSRDPANESAKIYTRLALHLRPDLVAARMLLGELLEAEKHYPASIAAYETIEDDSAYRWEARIRIAANLNRLDRVEETVRLLRKMAQERPEDTRALTAAADILRSRERFNEAVIEYDRVFERIDTIEKRHWSLLYARGIAHERSKQWPKAEQDFLRALELMPNQPLVLNYLGYSWIDQGVNLERAMGMIRSAVEQRPNDGYIVDSLGWAHYRLEQYDEAVEQLERAVELRPEDPVINDHLGDAYWRVGRQLEARFQWQHALALGAESDQVPLIEAKLENGLPPE